MRSRSAKPILFAMLAAVLSAAAWIAFIGPLDRILVAFSRERIEHALAAYVQPWKLSVSYHSASPSFALGLSMRDLRISTPGGSSLYLRRVRLGLDIVRSLVSGQLVWTDGVLLEGVQARLNLDGDRELLTTILRALQEPGTDSAPSLGKLGAVLRGASLELVSDSLPALSIDIRRASMDAGDDKSIAFSVAGTLRANDPDWRFGFGSALVPLSVLGKLDADGTLALSGTLMADTALGSLSEVRMSASLSDSLGQLSLDAGKTLESLRLSYDRDSGLARMEGSFKDFVPLGLFIPKGKLAFLRPYFRYPVNGSVNISSDVSLAGTAGSVSLRGRLPPEFLGTEAGFSIDASGSPNGMDIRNASIDSGQLFARYRGRFRLAGLGANGILEGRWRGPNGLFAEASAELFGDGSSWFFLADQVSVGGPEGQTALSDFTASISADGGFSFVADAALPLSLRSGLHSEAGSGDAPPQLPPRINLEGTVTVDAGKPYLAATVKLDPFALAPFSPVLSALGGRQLSSVVSDFTLGSSISVFSDFKDISYSSGDTLIVYKPWSPAYAFVSFSGDTQNLSVRELKANIRGYEVSGSASLDFDPAGPLGFALNLSVQDVPYRFSGGYMDGSLFVSGDYGTSISMSSSGGITRFRAAVDAMPVPLGSGVGLLSLASDGMYASDSDWALSLSMFELDAPSSSSSIPDLSMLAFINQDGGSIHDIHISDRVSDVSGFIDLQWQPGGGIVADGSLSGPGSEGYALSARYASRTQSDDSPSPKQWSAELVLSAAPVARLGIQGLEGLLDARVNAQDIFGKAKADFTFNLNGGASATTAVQDKLSASGSGAYRDETLYLVDTSASYQGQKLSELAARYDLSSGSASLSATVELALGAQPVVASIRAEGASDAPPGANRLSSYSLSGSVDSMDWMGAPVSPWPFSATIDGRAVSIRAGSNGEAVADLGTNGELYVRLDQSLPLSLVANGQMLDGSFSVDARDIVLDASLIFPLLGTNEVSAVSGTLKGSLALRGTLSEPNISGSMHGDNVFLLVTNYVSEAIGPLDEPFFFTGTALESDQSGMRCGSAQVSASIVAPFGGGFTEPVRISVRTDGVVPLETTVLGLDIKGKASTALSLSISGDQIGVSGSVNVAQGDVVLTTGLFADSDKPVDPYAAPALVALDVSFGKSVRVSFPDRRVPLFYGQADPSSKIRIEYDGVSGDFSLKGKAVLRGGNVFYIQRSFYLKSASIDFNESAASFDPIISVDAETRSRNEQGPVLIVLKADKVRMSSLAFTLSSKPAMSEADIARLLGQDLLAIDEEGQSDLGRLLVENSDLVPQLNIMSLFERTAQDILGLDVFMVRSLALQRWVYDLSGLGGESAYTLGDYLDDTAITMGKYLGQGLYLQARFRLLQPELASAGNLRLDSEFSMEWATPHFLLTWSLAPQNWNTLFVTDQTISLFWSIPLK